MKMVSKKISNDGQKKNGSEKQLYRDLVLALTPSKSAHQFYLENVVEFTSKYSGLMNTVGELSDEIPIRMLNVVRSELFSRDYLVAYVDSKWLKATAPGCDAIASPELKIGELRSPPLVIAPEKKARVKSVSFRSTLEHEFVHINQALLGVFPSTDEIGTNPFRSMINILEAEYQANFLQLSRWPILYSKAKKIGISLQDWCILRGYTQALEAVVTAILLGQLTASEVERYLVELPKKLPFGFQKIGLKKQQGEYFVTKLPEHLLKAVTLQINRGIYPKNLSAGGFAKLKCWIKESAFGTP